MINTIYKVDRGDTVVIPILATIPAGAITTAYLRQTPESPSYYVLVISGNSVIISSSITEALVGHWEFDIQTVINSNTETVQHTDLFFVTDITRNYESGITPQTDGAAIAVTYAALKSLVDTSALIQGKSYYISDYCTKHNIYSGNTVTTTINTGTIEPLLVQAISATAIGTSAFSPAFPKDIINYDFTQNLCEDLTTARTGKIIYRKDRYGNSAPYDLYVVKHMVFPLVARTWTNSLVFVNDQICEYLGIIYKCKIVGAGAGTTESIGENPIAGKNWIPYLNKNIWDSYIFDKTSIAGDIVDATKTWGTPKLVYTFCDASGTLHNELFRGVEIHENNTDLIQSQVPTTQQTKPCVYPRIVCQNTVSGKIYSGIKLSKTTNNIFIQNSYDLSINSGCHSNIITNSYSLNLDTFSVRNIINSCSNIKIAIGTGNVINNSSLMLFNGETPSNSIRRIADCVTGADFWGNNIQNLIYSHFANTTKLSFFGYCTHLNFLGYCDGCYFPDGCENITALTNLYYTTLPANARNIIWEAYVVGSGVNLSEFETLLATDEQKRIVGDRSNGGKLYVITRDLETGAEIYTLLK